MTCIRHACCLFRDHANPCSIVELRLLVVKSTLSISRDREEGPEDKRTERGERYSATEREGVRGESDRQGEREGGRESDGETPTVNGAQPPSTLFQ
jgi:hypothetical protein